MSAFRCTENPDIPDVYEVLVYVHGVQHPRAHESAIYSYFDGVDTWSAWEFSRSAALRAKPSFKGIRPWRHTNVTTQ